MAALKPRTVHFERMQQMYRAVIVLASVVAAFNLPTATPSASAVPRPNVVILMSDDQRWDKVTQRYTPEIWDRLVAGNPYAFTQSFVPNPLCCPSRTSTLTGRFSHTTGVWGNSGTNGGFAAFDDTSTLATDFEAAGYRTAMFGKYLNGYKGGKDRYVPPGWSRWFATNTGSFYHYGVTSCSGACASHRADLRGYGHKPEADYIVNVLEDHVENWVGHVSSKDDPFFLYYSFTGPHGPAVPDPDDVGRFAGDPDFGFRRNSGKRIPGSSMLDSAYSVDRAVGKLLDVLPSNTIVIYMSDNGFLWGEHGVTGKKQPYNEDVRVPIVLKSLDGSYVPAVGTDDIVLNIDLRPTLDAAAGIDVPSRVDGIDWGASTYEPRQRFVIEHSSDSLAWCGTREAGWTYARFADGTELLYDDAADPLQQVNLVSEPSTQNDYDRLHAYAVEECYPEPPGFSW